MSKDGIINIFRMEIYLKFIYYVLKISIFLLYITYDLMPFGYNKVFPL